MEENYHNAFLELKVNYKNSYLLFAEVNVLYKGEATL